MSKISRGRSWIEERLADRRVIDGDEYTVDLVARRSTGVQGFRVTIVYLPREPGAAEVQVELPNATSTADVHRRVQELLGAPDRIDQLFREAKPR
jgi:hypothetical protein